MTIIYYLSKMVMFILYYLYSNIKFKELHVYYTTRIDNSLKKMQSLIVIACKLLRIIYGILKNGTVYDPKKMLRDIRRPEKKEVIAA